MSYQAKTVLLAYVAGITTGLAIIVVIATSTP